ncbi:hypothetical protein PanWU01x14_165340 [Parasponia andersonii]|uniref:Uncharacterized protein n=1 Tax=Parasponia andersonii TaxID=3476 RepID=A0A2P5CCD3_PARAD|nr:hypothetical protein PanWU01x14_165340 [Parasponia andersonii]
MRAIRLHSSHYFCKITYLPISTITIPIPKSITRRRSRKRRYRRRYAVPYPARRNRGYRVWTKGGEAVIKTLLRDNPARPPSRRRRRLLRRRRSRLMMIMIKTLQFKTRLVVLGLDRVISAGPGGGGGGGGGDGGAG